jgi:NAD(P)-dependent dehydrogenase (short-subunit alcohol dehydrogenase family)
MRLKDKVAIITGAAPHGTAGSPGGSAAYASAKAAVIMLTKTLARELGPGGVTVNCIAPGTFVTPISYSTRTPEQVHEHLDLLHPRLQQRRHQTPPRRDQHLGPLVERPLGRFDELRHDPVAHRGVLKGQVEHPGPFDRQHLDRDHAAVQPLQSYAVHDAAVEAPLAARATPAERSCR